jgi:DNA repair exonuclease SbcCD ATPase subunit/predicted phosphodiesterase
MIKIAHFADTHIRNLKYHDEYRFVFDKIYRKLEEQKPDYIVHCGDLAHTKTQLSPEYFALATEFLKSLADIAPTYIILGNHDGNLKNSDREDAVSPIANALNHPQLFLLKRSGRVSPQTGLSFNVLSIFDRGNWMEPKDGDINVALYHGAIMGSTTGTGWAMDHGDDDINIFKGHDFVMLGDIHKPQILDTEGRVQYAGSTIQQKFSEDGRKGYKLWTIRSEDDFDVQHVIFTNPRPFITIRLDDKGEIPEHYHVPRGCRLRLISTINMDSSSIRKVSDLARTKYCPVSLSFLNKGTSEFTSSDGEDHKMENMRDASVQEKYIREYLQDYELDESIMSQVLDLNTRYNKEVEKNEEVRRNVKWNIKEMEFKNLFNYGEGNRLDFGNLSGIVGIFGKNYSGKSSVIDSALYGIYGGTSKAEKKNVHLINQNKDKASIRMVVEADGQEYQICRNLNKSTKTHKGKSVYTSSGDLDFHNLTTNSSCNGDSIKDTDANIRKIFGSIEDFMITSMASQMDSLSFIKEGSTKRKNVLAKFLDLDIFEQKLKHAKKDSAEIAALVKRFKNKRLGEQLVAKQEEIEEINDDIDTQTDLCKKHNKRYEELLEELRKIQEEISSIPAEVIDIDDIEDEIENWHEQIHKAGVKVKANNKTIESNLPAIEQTMAILRSLDEDRLLHLETEALTLTKSLKGFESEMRDLKSKEKITLKKINMLHNHEYDPDCKFCSDNKFVKDANKAKSYLPTLEEEIDEVKKIIDVYDLKLGGLDLEGIQKDLKVLKTQRLKRDKLLAENRNLELTNESLNSKIELMKNTRSSLQEKRDEYNENRQAIESLSSLIRSKDAVSIKMGEAKARKEKCDKKIQNYLVELGSVKHSIKMIKEEKLEQDKLEDDFAAYELFMRCMHPNGIAYEIIKQKLSLINEEIQKCLTNIVDFQVMFEEDGKNLDINIRHPKYESRPITMGSGAEKTIAAMAIRLALIEITNLPKSTVFIMDEPATALDQEHMEGFIRLIDMIKDKFKTVLLISHLDVLKDCVDKTIDIQKVGGYAKVNC